MCGIFLIVVLNGGVVMQYEDGRSKGYGLVEFTTAEEAQDAIKMLNDTELLGRVMFVREDREAGVGSISSLAKGNVKGKYRERPRTDNEAGVELLVGNVRCIYLCRFFNVSCSCRTVPHGRN